MMQEILIERLNFRSICHLYKINYYAIVFLAFYTFLNSFAFFLEYKIVLFSKAFYYSIE